MYKNAQQNTFYLILITLIHYVNNKNYYNNNNIFGELNCDD